MTSGAEAATESKPRLTGWSMYSWANHGWETTVATVLIGPWLLALATVHRKDSATIIGLGALHLRAESLPSAALTVAAILQFILLPPLGVAADRWAAPQRLLTVACVTGSVIAVLLAATAGGAWVAAAILFIVGTVVYGASNVVYNSFLPRIAGPADRDAVSSRGFAYGYVGGGLLLAANLVLLLIHDSLGLSKATAVRICFVSAGVWWLGFGIGSIRRLVGEVRYGGDPVTAGAGTRIGVWRTITAELRDVVARPQAARYLIAYLLFSDAISAVIALAATFITHEIFGDSASRASTFLFELILLIQFVAVLGAVMFARIAGAIGAKRALLASLLIWCAVIVYAYLAVRSKATAVVAGVVIGVVLGGSQALARSLWSQLVPPGREATYFGVFEVANEGTAWIAPLLFTIVVNVTGSFRQAILSLLILFVAGGILLARTDIDAAIAGR